MYNVGKFKKLVQITTESAYLQTFWIYFGPVSDSIIAALSVSTVCISGRGHEHVYYPSHAPIACEMNIKGIKAFRYLM
jgi:hypothetical protein